MHLATGTLLFRNDIRNLDIRNFESIARSGAWIIFLAASHKTRNHKERSERQREYSFYILLSHH